MAISFVADAEWNESNDDTSYTLQKPTGTASGDLLIAVLALDLANDGANSTTVNAPSGWTIVSNQHAVPNLQNVVMTRTAGSSEPGSWNGTLASGRGPKASIVAAYRGVAGIVDWNDNTTGAGTSVNTGTVTNPTSTNWRVVMAGYTSASVSYTLTSNEVIKREGASRSTVECGSWDSNGTISTGNTSRTVSRGAQWEGAAAYIAILDATDTAIPGTLGVSAPLPVVSCGMELEYTGTMAVTAPTPTMTSSGIATPPEGAFEVLVLPLVDVAGSVIPTGSFDVVAAPIVNIVGETRKFGIRVVTPEAESRVTTPRLGAVD